MSTLATTVDGLKFTNPFVIGSGPPGTNVKVIKRAFKEGWGGVIAKTVSLDSSKVVNVGPRYAKLHANDGKEVIGWENIELISDRKFDSSVLKVSKQFTEKQSKALKARIKAEQKAMDDIFEPEPGGARFTGAVAKPVKGIITGVPFVDVVTTMSDPSIPLTTGEYTEWGNPAIQAEYDYMKSYSPYDNMKKGNYPNLLVLTSFADSQVQYFEPAKYVARLRDLKTDNNLLLFKTNMTGSHGGSSGRFKRLEERALEYAWMMGLLGMDGGGMKQ